MTRRIKRTGSDTAHEQCKRNPTTCETVTSEVDIKIEFTTGHFLQPWRPMRSIFAVPFVENLIGFAASKPPTADLHNHLV